MHRVQPARTVHFPMSDCCYSLREEACRWNTRSSEPMESRQPSSRTSQLCWQRPAVGRTVLLWKGSPLKTSENGERGEGVNLLSLSLQWNGPPLKTSERVIEKERSRAGINLLVQCILLLLELLEGFGVSSRHIDIVVPFISWYQPVLAWS